MSDTEKRLCEKQVESYGRLLAGFSHEMKNHLGIIRESAGLAADLIEMNKNQMDPVFAERLGKTTETIEKRIVIMAMMFKHLSSFAHRSDTPLSNFPVYDLLEDEFIFLERFARMKEVHLELKKEEDVQLTSSPALLHHIIFRIFSICLGKLSAGDTLTLAASPCEQGAQIAFLTPKVVRVQADLDGEDLAALASISGEIKEEGGVVLEFADLGCFV